MNIIPAPRKIEITGGEIRIKKTYKIENNNNWNAVFEYLEKIISIDEKAENRIVFERNSGFGEEEYTIEIDDIIRITSNGEKGAFRACTTLKQILKNDRVEKQIIHDYPMIKNRGLLICGIPKLDRLLEMIDIIGDLKYNQLQLSMDGFDFEYKHFWEYCKNEEPVTIKELEIIKEYCKKRFIELVPCQNGFGHMGKWLALPEFSSLAIKRDDGGLPDSLNPLDKRSTEFIDTIYSDLLPYFDSDKVNIGFDEVTSLGMGQTKEICEEKGVTKVFVGHLNERIKLMNEKYNKTPMFWGDMIFENPKMLEQVDKNSIVLNWGYENDMMHAVRGEFLKNSGYRFYSCPGTSNEWSFTGRFDNMVLNVEMAARSSILNNGEGKQLPEWWCDVPHFVPFSILPYIYGACCCWNFEAIKETSTLYDHTSYCKATDIIRRCEQYADDFIFEGAHVSYLLHMMGNYYLLENDINWCGTNIFFDIRRMINGEKVKIRPLCINAIINYMNIIKRELDTLKDDIKYIDEIKFVCDLVILLGKILLAYQTCQKMNFKNELEKIRNRGENLYKGFIRGSLTDNFIKYIDGLITFI